MNHFNPIRNQNYSLFFQNSPFASSLWPLNRGLFLPRSLGPKRLHSKWATLAPKIVLYFTHRNGPIFGAKTDLLDLECVNQAFMSLIHHIWGETVLWGTVFIIQTSDNRMQYFRILRYKLPSFNTVMLKRRPCRLQTLQTVQTVQTEGYFFFLYLNFLVKFLL